MFAMFPSFCCAGMPVDAVHAALVAAAATIAEHAGSSLQDKANKFHAQVRI